MTAHDDEPHDEAQGDDLPDVLDDQVLDAELLDDDEDDDDDYSDDVDGFSLGGGGFDLGGLLGQVGEMQQRLMDAQAGAADTVVEGAAGGGVVKIEVTGGFEFQSVTIDPSAVDPNDVGMLQDLILAALHDASARVAEVQAQVQSQAMGGIDLGGLFGGS